MLIFSEQHLEKTPIGYIQWRFQAGHDKEVLEKITRVLTPEEKELLEKEWVGRNGEKRKIEVSVAPVLRVESNVTPTRNRW